MRISRLISSVALATAVVAGTVAFSNHANASTYDFSYTFNTGDVISGSFTGTGPVTDVTGISNISASFDLTPLAGPLYAWHYTAPGSDCSTCWLIGGAVASSNPLSNNFLFINSNATGFTGYTNYFYIIPWPNGGGNPVATQYEFGSSTSPNYVDYYNGQYISANWSLTAVATPLPSTWVMLLSGFVGLGYFAYRGTKKNSAALAAA
jgi:hypothetical protein